MDATFPVYDITLITNLYHPLDEVLNVTFNPSLIDAVNVMANEVKITLNPLELSYSPAGSDTLEITFAGSVQSLAYAVPSIQLQGTVEFQSFPSNGHTYNQPVSFQEVLVRHAEIFVELVSTSMELTEGTLLVLEEEALFRATITNIVNFGPSNDLMLMIRVNGTYLNIMSTEIVQIG